jgi:quercetin 2,3-dioxygenase
MLRVRPSAKRGIARFDGVDSRHTFSFGEYFDPEFMGFRALRVINEDRVAAKTGFPRHPHRDMEILTYVLSGALEHKDSLGNGEVLRPGEFQRMTAGRGIRHSEFNPSATEPVHLYQIWLLPRQPGLPPSYEQRPFDPAGRERRWQLVASPDGAAGSLTIQQDARIHLANIAAGKELPLDLTPGRHGWLQVLNGEVAVNGTQLAAGDAAAISEVQQLVIAANSTAELLLFDLS